MINTDDAPRSLKNPEVRKRRHAMLDRPHMAPLNAYVNSLRRCNLGEVPDFDPLDGGIHARILFLFEKPGPMTAGGRGSGLISRNNDDPTAEACFRFMAKAKIARKLTVTWNVIPWWNDTRKITPSELRAGLACLEELIALLPKLAVVVLVGNKAGLAKPYVLTSGKKVLVSSHPSPLVRASYPARWKAIPREWAKATAFLS
ncbi:MAG: uracil-DNA glycosylase [Terriglobales bacterium]